MSNAQARRLLQMVQNQLSQLDGTAGVPVDADAVRSSAQDSLRKLDGIIAEMRNALNSASAAKRAVAARKVDELEQQASFLRRGLESNIASHSRVVREQQERDALLGGAAAAGDGMLPTSLVQESESLGRSRRMVEEMQEMGRAALSSLHDQGGVLKAAQRKLLDVSSSIGLSAALLRVIERRETADKLIVYGGMVVVLLVLWLCVWLVG